MDSTFRDEGIAADTVVPIVDSVAGSAFVKCEAAVYDGEELCTDGSPVIRRMVELGMNRSARFL